MCKLQEVSHRNFSQMTEQQQKKHIQLSHAHTELYVDEYASQTDNSFDSMNHHAALSGDGNSNVMTSNNSKNRFQSINDNSGVSNMDENQDMTNVSEPSADAEKDVHVMNANMDNSHKLDCNGKNATEIEAKGVHIDSNFKENCSLCRIIEINGEIIDVDVINLNDCNNDHTLRLSCLFYLQDV